VSKLAPQGGRPLLLTELEVALSPEPS